MHDGVKDRSAKTLALKPTTRKIAILGTTPSRGQAPLDDPEWEIWTIGPGGKDLHRWERLFETHTVWPLEFGEKQDGKSYLDDLSRVTAPQSVYTLQPMGPAMERWARDHGRDRAWLKEHVTGGWSSNVVIDREALYDKYCRMVFQSSIDYCLATAIEEGATDIGCWGIDLEAGEEYVSQWASAKVWLMLARLAGINIHLPVGSGLERDITPYPTRYETHLALTLEKKQGWLESLVAQREGEFDQLRLEVARLEGALLLMRSFLNPDVLKEFTENPVSRIQIGEQELTQMNIKAGQAAANVNHQKGELSATLYLRRMYCWGMGEPGLNQGHR